MAGRGDERERLRGQQLEAEQHTVEEARRRRLVGLVTAGVLVAATIAAIVIVVAAGGGSDQAADADDAFGPHYEGLADRRSEAGVAVMSDPAQGGEHIHPVLSVYVNGEQVAVPPNIGIDPAQPPDQMAGLHTHDPTGTIHIENAVDPTLGQFFEIWGVPFSAQHLGPHQNRGAEKVRMWVDGQPSRAFGDLGLEDGQQIVIAYGGADERPPGVEP